MSPYLSNHVLPSITGIYIKSRKFIVVGKYGLAQTQNSTVLVNPCGIQVFRIKLRFVSLDPRFLYKLYNFIEEEKLSNGLQGWHSGESTCRPPTGLGSVPRLAVLCGLSLFFVLVLAPRSFSPGTLVFPSPQKPTFPNSDLIWNLRATGLSVVRLLSVILVKQS